MGWSNQFATGIKRIDRQHKLIFRMAEDFRSSLDEGGGERMYHEMLQALDRYARAHFGFEERCMEEYRCPLAQKNKEEHERFVEVLSRFRQRYAASGFNRTDAYALVNTIDRWLTEHIRRVDVHLKDSVERP